MILSIIKDLHEYITTFNSYKTSEPADFVEELNEFRNYNAIVKTLLRVMRGINPKFQHDIEKLLFLNIDKVGNKEQLKVLYKEIDGNAKALKEFEKEFIVFINVNDENSNVVSLDAKRKEMLAKQKQKDFKKAA